MSLNSCVFAVRLADPGLYPVLDERLERLRRFYEPLGPARLETSRLDRLDLVFGSIAWGDDQARSGPLIWGGPLPAQLANDRALIEARDTALREADGLVVAIAAEENRARLISGAGGLATLHRASSSDGEAFSTHAVAAAWLATGSASIAAERIPELLAHEYIGGEHSILREASVLQPAARIDFIEGETSIETYWPHSERWKLVAEDYAYEHATASLLESLDRRLPEEGVYLALTGGLDSRVVALALYDLGQPAGSFTWGEPDWDDVVEADAIAEELGWRNARQPIEYRDDERALELIDAEVRWNEGVTPVRFMAQRWPDDMTAAIYGTAGEVGRAFYYAREHVRGAPEPSAEELEEVFDGRPRIRGARREAQEQLRASEREWIADAHAAGATGWRCLDILYADQRVRRWGRAMLSQSNAIMVPAFATPEIMRALVSMSLRDRLDDRFHRRFLSSMPELAEPGPDPLPPRSPVRRLVAPLPGVRRFAMARRARRDRDRWGPADEWRSRPNLRSWIADDALGSSLIEEALGRRWAEETRDGFMKDDSVATTNALLAAAPVALDAALQQLRAG